MANLNILEARHYTGENTGFVLTSLSDQSIAAVKSALDNGKPASFWPRTNVRVYELDRARKGSKGQLLLDSTPRGAYTYVMNRVRVAAGDAESIEVRVNRQNVTLYVGKNIVFATTINLNGTAVGSVVDAFTKALSAALLAAVTPKTENQPSTAEEEE